MEPELYQPTSFVFKPKEMTTTYTSDDGAHSKATLELNETSTPMCRDTVVLSVSDYECTAVYLLDQERAAQLIVLLQHFVSTGTLPKGE